MEHIAAIEQLIDIVINARDQISNIANLPEAYKTRAERALTILANSSAHSIGKPIEDLGEAPTMEFPPVTNFMGKEIHVKKPNLNAKVSEEALALYRNKVNGIVESIADLTPKQFYDKYEETEIRGAAKMLGMRVTTTEPALITMEFIEEIYTRHGEKVENEPATADEDLGNETLTEDEERAVLVQEVIMQMQETAKLKEFQFGEDEAEAIRQILKETPLDKIREAVAEAKEVNMILTEETKAPATPAQPKETKAPAPATPAQPKETKAPATKKK